MATSINPNSDGSWGFSNQFFFSGVVEQVCSLYLDIPCQWLWDKHWAIWVMRGIVITTIGHPWAWMAASMGGIIRLAMTRTKSRPTTHKLKSVQKLLTCTKTWHVGPPFFFSFDRSLSILHHRIHIHISPLQKAQMYPIKLHLTSRRITHWFLWERVNANPKPCPPWKLGPQCQYRACQL